MTDNKMRLPQSTQPRLMLGQVVMTRGIADVFDEAGDSHGTISASVRRLGNGLPV